MTTKQNPIGGDSAHFYSDGLSLQLENGRIVKPRIRDPDSGWPYTVTWVNAREGKIGLGPEADDTQVVMYLSPASAVFDDDGNRVWHYEWSGWLWCDREEDGFDWQTGEVECPHCGDVFHNQEPNGGDDNE